MRQDQQDPAVVSVPAFVLDDRAIERKLVDTAEVTALLGNLFADPDDEPPTLESSTHPESEPALPTVAALDGTHSLLLRALAKRGEWSRVDYEDLAKEYHLMPDGALDCLNEAAIEATGEPVIEGDDALTINQDTMEQLLT